MSLRGHKGRGSFRREDIRAQARTGSRKLRLLASEHLRGSGDPALGAACCRGDGAASTGRAPGQEALPGRGLVCGPAGWRWGRSQGAGGLQRCRAEITRGTAGPAGRKRNRPPTSRPGKLCGLTTEREGTRGPRCCTPLAAVCFLSPCFQGECIPSVQKNIYRAAPVSGALGEEAVMGCAQTKVTNKGGTAAGGGTARTWGGEVN